MRVAARAAPASPLERNGPWAHWPEGRLATPRRPPRRARQCSTRSWRS